MHESHYPILQDTGASPENPFDLYSQVVQSARKIDKLWPHHHDLATEANPGHHLMIRNIYLLININKVGWAGWKVFEAQCA
jgi:hypothetical protein